MPDEQLDALDEAWGAIKEMETEVRFAYRVQSLSKQRRETIANRALWLHNRLMEKS